MFYHLEDDRWSYLNFKIIQEEYFSIITNKEMEKKS